MATISRGSCADRVGDPPGKFSQSYEGDYSRHDQIRWPMRPNLRIGFDGLSSSLASYGRVGLCGATGPAWCLCSSARNEKKFVAPRLRHCHAAGGKVKWTGFKTSRGDLFVCFFVGLEKTSAANRLWCRGKAQGFATAGLNQVWDLTSTSAGKKMFADHFGLQVGEIGTLGNQWGGRVWALCLRKPKEDAWEFVLGLFLVHLWGLRGWRPLHDWASGLYSGDLRFR